MGAPHERVDGAERTAANPRCAVAVSGDDALASRISTVLARAGLPPSRPVSSLEHLLRGTSALYADVVVLAGDLSRPAMLACVRRVRSQRPLCSVVVVSSAPHALDVRRALNAGAGGYIEAGDLDEALGPTVRAVHAGQLCTPQSGRRVLAKPSFSARERQVVTMLAAGATNAQIASRLYLSESTVKSHMESIFCKLGVRSRNDVVALILDPEEGLRQTVLPAALPGPMEVV
jgi:DNA-binding NarL/FixJ family response regulator